MVSGEGYSESPAMITASPNPAYVGQTVTLTGTGFNTTPYPGDPYPVVACPMFGEGIFVVQPNGTFTAQASYASPGTISIYCNDRWGHQSNLVSLTVLPNASATPTASPQQGSPTPTQNPQGTTGTDTVAPVTTLSLTGLKDAAGAFTTNVVCTLTATDNAGGSGVNETRYSFDGFNWTTYTTPFTIATPGNTTIFYRSVDKAGNQEVARVEAMTIAGSVATPTGSAGGSGLCAAMVLPLMFAGFAGLYRLKKR